MISLSALPQASADPVGWDIQLVDDSHHVVTFDVDIDSNGYAHIIGANLDTYQFLYMTNTSGSWVTETFGTYSSNDISGAVDDNGKMHLSFYNDQHRLSYATNAYGAWSLEEVDHSDLTGAYSSLAIDSLGNVHIAYSRETDTYHQHLMYAHGQPGNWTIETADSATGNRGRNPNLVLDSNDRAHISFYDYGHLCVNYVTNVDGTWQWMSLPGITITSAENRIALDSEDNVHIVFSSYWDRTVRYATNAGGSWSLQDVDATVDSGYELGLVIDSADKVHVSYYFSLTKDLYYSNNIGGAFSPGQMVSEGDVMRHATVIDHTDKISIFFSNLTSEVFSCAVTSQPPTWAPQFIGAPHDGQECQAYAYIPQLNESVTFTAHDTDAPFLSWNGTGFIGTPDISQGGSYWMNITAQSLAGGLSAYHNVTFIIGESWAPTFTNAPSDGREYVNYVYEPSFNETVVVNEQSTNAPFLIWNGTAYVGTPYLNDQGEYWINITATSVDGLLSTYQNSTFTVDPMPSTLRINSDGEMDAAAAYFGWSGDGSENDPYIANGLVINSLGTFENSLFIGNVTYHFVVTQNSLGDHGPAGGWSDAVASMIYIYNCQFATVLDNYLWGGSVGLALFHSNNVIVSENQFVDFAETGALVMADCHGTHIENNTLSGDSAIYGIKIDSATGTSIKNNTLRYVYFGIYVNDDGFTPVDGVMIMDNLVDDFVYGVQMSDTINAMVVNNTFVDISYLGVGCGVYVVASQYVIISDNHITEGRNGIVVSHSDHIWMEGNTIDTLNGFYLDYVTEAYIADGSIISDAGIGIELFNTDSVTVRNTTITGTWVGIYIDGMSSFDNEIIGCRFSGFHVAGVFIVSSAHHNLISECDFRDFTEGQHTGVWINTGDGNTVLNNTFTGLYIGVRSEEMADNNAVIGNLLVNGNRGIIFTWADGGLIQDNTLMGMSIEDIALYDCSNTVLIGNDIFGERKQSSGIFLSNCWYITMHQNAIEEGAINFNLEYGTDTVSTHVIAENNTVGGKPVYYIANVYGNPNLDNTVIPGDGGQIIIVASSHFTLLALETTSCTSPVLIFSSGSIRLQDLKLNGSGVGVIMIYSSDVQIERATITNMSIGILGWSVSDVVINRVHLVNNYDGVRMENTYGPCDQVFVMNSKIENSGRYGIVYDGVDNSWIAFNVIANSTSYGVMITATDNVNVAMNLFYRNNGVGDTYSSIQSQAFDDSPNDYFHTGGKGNFWSEQLGPDADGDGIVDDFIYQIGGELNTDEYPMALVFNSEPVSEGRNRTAYSYQADVGSEVEYELFTNAGFLSISPSGYITGVPNARGEFSVSVKATLMNYLVLWQNYTLTITETWAPSFTNSPGNGQETVDYEYEPSFNETVSIVGFETDASFLAWSGTAFVGTPGQSDAGTYWMNITVQSVSGLLFAYQNLTFVIGESWAPTFTNEPSDGQETVVYQYEPSFNETVSIIGFETDASFLSWNGTAFVGTPGQSDAGTYWMNITVQSVSGLLFAYQNLTFVIGESWAPTFTNEPSDGQETIDYVFLPTFNETVAVNGHLTNASFLAWNGSAYVGTPGTSDAGTYWINITATSVDGLLTGYLNSTLVIGESWAPSFTNAPGNGQVTVEFAYAPEFNETVSIDVWSTNASFLAWNGSAYVGTPGTSDAGTYWINITATSVDGLLTSYLNSTFLIGESWMPSFTNEPLNGRESVEYEFLPTFNETVIIVSVDTDAPFLTWNGTALVGIPGLSDAGTYWVNVTATSEIGLLTDYLNSTFVIDEAWAPEIVSEAVLEARETLDYEYVPEANETVTWAFSSDASFLSWNGTAVVGTPGLDDSGAYYVSLTATSVDGLLSSYQNYTLNVKDTWRATFTNEPSDGRETVEYVFQPTFNETVAVTSRLTSAPFLRWNGSAFAGTPTTAQAGVYWINITVQSVDGLLSSYQRRTIVIGESWAPTFLSEPTDGQFFAILNYTYLVQVNETAVLVLNTNATFLDLANGTVFGTMVAGSYYVNVTALSVEGLLVSWQNFTLVVVNDQDAPMVNIITPLDGARFNSTNVSLEWNATDDGSGVIGSWYQVDGGDWVLLEDGNVTLDLDEGEHTIVVMAEDAVGNQGNLSVTFSVDITSPTVISAGPEGEDVAIDQALIIRFSEPMDHQSVVVTVNGEPMDLTWGGNNASIAGDWAYDTEYAVIVNGQDLFGNALEQYAWNFQTGIQLVTVIGTIMDQSGDPVANATLTIDGIVVATTDVNGVFILLIAPGSYDVTVSADGFQDQTVPLEVGDGPTELDLDLERVDGGSNPWPYLVMILVGGILVFAIYRGRKD